MPYEPRLPVPEEPRELAAWLAEEFRRIADSRDDAREFIVFDVLHEQPDRVYAGMVVIADGSDWDPGSGAGMYQRNEANDAWVFIG